MDHLFVTQPYLLSAHPDKEMHICWIQRQPLTGTVEYGGTERLGKYAEAKCYALNGLRIPFSSTGYAEIPEDNPIISLWQCVATLTGLHPGQKLYYRCLIRNSSTPIYHFHTAPPKGEPFRFAQLSDLQATAPCDQIVHRIGCQKPDFILYSGDACIHSWRADQWFDLGEDWQSEQSRKQAFFPCLQQENGAELTQYCPLFICPGNHEVDDLRVGTNQQFSQDDSHWNWSIFMQLFRPLYPDALTGLQGKRWYSADYGDLHIVSLSIQRWATWGAYEAPGWRLVDPIEPDSPQFSWLQQDLVNSSAPYKWVIQHWHLLNRGYDVQPPLCQPVLEPDDSVSYPLDHTALLMDTYRKYGVNAVSYGHSHVYERYFANGVHYIEAANFTICYREAKDPPHPSGLTPIVEDNSQHSFLMISRNNSGLQATGYYADTGIPFDTYQIANAQGQTVPPNHSSEVLL